MLKMRKIALEEKGLLKSLQMSTCMCKDKIKEKLGQGR